MLRTEILNKTFVGFEFEFMTDLNNNELIDKLQEALEKKIVLCDKYHSEAQISDKVFKVEPDFSAGTNGKELVTGPIPYEEGIIIFDKMVDFMNEYCYTNEKTAFQPNLSFSKSLIKSLKHELNVIKFILSIDEDYIYSKFPNRKHNLYAKSIKKLKCINSNFVMGDNAITNNIIEYPNTKYYGINFEKLLHDYLEVRYLGGKDYEKKGEEIKEIWHYVLELMYKCSMKETREYTEENVKSVHDIINNNRIIEHNLVSVDKFKKAYPEIKLSVDLSYNPKVIENKLPLIKNKIYNLLLDNDINSGCINYDSDSSKLQIKELEITNGKLMDLDILKCKLNNCTISNSELIQCNIENSEIKEIKLRNSEVNNSRLTNCYVNKNSTLTGCFIKGRAGFFDGKLMSGIFREGNITKNAMIHKDVEVIEYRKFN